MEKQLRGESQTPRIPPQCQTDNLLLLIGTNPLPNLVAARLLLKGNGTLYLVHSKDTSDAAIRIETLLARKYGISNCRRVEVREADAQDIKDKIGNQLRNLKGSTGLHYTGGTKTMAVHTYRTIETVISDADPSPVFSYLDANSFQLRIDPSWHEKVLLEVRPTLEDLLTLHGITLKSGFPHRAVVLPETAAALAQAAPDGGLLAWRDWCTGVLRDQAHTGKDWKKKSQLRCIDLPLPTTPTLQAAVQTLKSELHLPAGTITLSLDPSHSQWPFHKNEPKYLCQWLDGAWLEYYALSQIKAVSGKCQLHDWGMTLATDVESSLFEFEFDLAAIRGYQLFGLSCTTDVSKTICKSKLFEAYIRSRQLGGDEARVGLVCGYLDPARLQSEMAHSWEAEGKLMVWGPHHLPDLSDYLSHWFETAG